MRQTRAYLIATGSEVELAVSAAAELTAEGKKVRVVSVPATDAFTISKTRSTVNTVLPSDYSTYRSKLASLTSGTEVRWLWWQDHRRRRVRANLHQAGELFKMFGFTTENVVKAYSRKSCLLNRGY
ncbi:hypothetical protein O9929_07225 [Vibrio lentus]|nr:hypothetical protein [Vibrio lentus]